MKDALEEAATEIERLNAEVLEQCRINGMSAEREDALRAELTRLKASIALDKMAENTRELGLNYEPTAQEGRDWSLLEATQESLREHMAEIVRLKAAQNPWVNLTDKEMEDLWAIYSGLPLYRAIEAKLKEKNHD
jgi:hypothetical protein